MQNTKWTESEKSIIISSYRSLEKDELMKLLPNRTWDAIKLRATILGAAKHKNEWSDSEINILKENWGKVPIRELDKLIPSKNRKLMSYMANKFGLKGNKSLSIRKHKFNENFFDVPNLINSYIGGWVASDGNICKTTKNSFKISVHIQIDDIEILEYIKKQTQYEGVIQIKKAYIRKFPNYHKPSHCKSSCELVINSNRFAEKLYENWNITTRKSLTYIGPKSHGYGNDLAFVKGYLEGDGSLGIINANNNKNIYPYFMICSSSKKSLEFIQNFLNTNFDMNINITEEKLKSGGIKYKIQKSENGILRFLREMRSLPVQSLSRKWNKPELVKFLDEDIPSSPNIIQNSTIIPTTSHV